MSPGPVLALVEINNPMLLVVAAVFVLAFGGVCAVAYGVLVKGRRDGGQRTWQFDARLPLTQKNVERVAAATAAAVSVPEVTPAARASSARSIQTSTACAIASDAGWNRRYRFTCAKRTPATDGRASMVRIQGGVRSP